MLTDSLKKYFITHIKSGLSNTYVGFSSSMISRRPIGGDERIPEVCNWNPNRKQWKVVGLREEPKWITCQVTGEPGDRRFGGGY
jgi:hypothetical protein